MRDQEYAFIKSTNFGSSGKEISAWETYNEDPEGFLGHYCNGVQYKLNRTEFLILPDYSTRRKTVFTCFFCYGQRVLKSQTALNQDSLIVKDKKSLSSFENKHFEACGWFTNSNNFKQWKFPALWITLETGKNLFMYSFIYLVICCWFKARQWGNTQGRRDTLILLFSRN